jgi:hypothetical protein
VLTKTAFQEFLRCPREFWLRHHQPDLYSGEPSLEGKHRREQGYEVQRYARQLALFTNLDPDRYHLQHEKQFRTADLYAKSDTVVTDKVTGSMHIYEVKSSTKKKPEYIDDIAFQKHLAGLNGHFVASTHLITVNNKYVRNGHVDANELLQIEDVSDEVNEREADIRRSIIDAFAYLNTEPAPSFYELCDEKLDCSFIRHYHPNLPECTIFDIPGLSEKKRRALLDQGIIDICKVPADFELTPRQRRLVDAACSGQIFIDADEIRRTIGELKFPLHFLDYESANLAVPYFSGTRPYQQVVFQYSLHTLREPGGIPEHRCFLSSGDNGHPSGEMAHSLAEVLAGEIGTVVVWSSFEKTRNNEIAAAFPEFGDFFGGLNGHLFDLERIFSGHLFIHPAFRCRTSIKKVLPVLCPLHSYEGLAIADGTSASINWYHMITHRHPEPLSTRIHTDLLKYCELDTMAMLRIYELLAGI